jgi:hypothetical protein
VYIGDLVEDEQIAGEAGCCFVPAPDLHDGTLEDEVEMSAQPRAGYKAAAFDRARRFVRTDADVAALAFFHLLMNPGSEDRREHQRDLFANLSPDMKRCVLTISPGLFQMRRELITDFELTTDVQLYYEYLCALQQLLPTHWFQYQDLAGGPLTVGYFTLYKLYGEQLRVAKDFRKHGGRSGSWFQSGPEVQLALIELIADRLAAELVDPPLEPLVAVPSSPPSALQPGQVSTRLAHLAAERADRRAIDLLAKNSDGSFSYCGDPSRQSVIVIDDQLTDGTSMCSAVEALRQHGDEVNTAFVFSVSRKTVSHLTHPTAEAGCRFTHIAGRLRVKCPCGSDPAM